MIAIRSRALRGTLVGPALLALGCININLPGGVPEPLVETVLRGSFGPKILLVSIDGVLQEGREPADFFGITGESRIARLREELDAARQDAEIGGLLLRINSPGGTVTASEIIYEEIRRFKRERGVPVVAQLMEIGRAHV